MIKLLEEGIMKDVEIEAVGPCDGDCSKPQPQGCGHPHGLVHDISAVMYDIIPPPHI